VSPQHPVVVSKFIENAKELEMDAVACRGDLVLSAISEHVENAGVHSGDATLVLPPQRTYIETMRRVKRITAQIARALELHGPFNIQFIAKGNDVKVIECNVRASRSFPFVSKILGTNFAAVATEVLMGRREEEAGFPERSFARSPPRGAQGAAVLVHPP
jgi:carbamoyl-phosphate synthase large subunit